MGCLEMSALHAMGAFKRGSSKTVNCLGFIDSTPYKEYHPPICRAVNYGITHNIFSRKLKTFAKRKSPGYLTYVLIEDTP